MNGGSGRAGAVAVFALWFSFKERFGEITQSHDVAKLQPVVLNHGSPVFDVAVHSFTDCVATGADDGKIKLWTLPECNDAGAFQGEPAAPVVLEGHSKRVTSVAWHPTASGVLSSASSNGEVGEKRQRNEWPPPAADAEEGEAESGRLDDRDCDAGDGERERAGDKGISSSGLRATKPTLEPNCPRRLAMALSPFWCLRIPPCGSGSSR